MKPEHVAIIMDGNGRWGQARGLPRSAGHAAGVDAVRSTVESAVELGVGTLTLFAMSADNFCRPRLEVEALLRLFDRYLRAETARCVREGVRMRVIGERERLPASLVQRVDASETATAECKRMTLRIAIDYSARRALLRAAQRASADGPLDLPAFEQRIGFHPDGCETALPVDLLIRTGGEQRLSDFLLWECAYAELYFTETLWPDFGRRELDRALRAFARRERRFGSVPQAVAS